MNTEFLSPQMRRLHTITRRQFLHNAGRFSLGAIALQSLLGKACAGTPLAARTDPLAPKAPPNPRKGQGGNLSFDEWGAAIPGYVRLEA